MKVAYSAPLMMAGIGAAWLAPEPSLLCGVGGRDVAGCLNVPSNVRREVGSNGTTA
jgi:hypothetical protein